MKKILTLSLFFAALFAVNSASAQDRTSTGTGTRQDTTKVTGSKPTNSDQSQQGTGTKGDDKKTDKKSTGSGTNNGTRMAISEQGVVVDKKDKKKGATNKTANTGNNTTTTTSEPKK